MKHYQKPADVALVSVRRPVGETKVTCKGLGVEEKRDERVEVLEG